jgi:hypothetical protein
VPEAGRHYLLVRYACPAASERAVTLDGESLGSIELPATGGYSSTADDWRVELLRDDVGEPIATEAEPGPHVLRLANTDGRGCNLDYLELVPAP